ncbi:MAG: helix-turn-helix domain-containing protein [Alphaproteobacteria bacterium]
MSQELYSVFQVASLLDLHVKTVRGYVRDGRLKAVRIGKQYRITREDVEALIGQPASVWDPPVMRHRHVEVSSIVEIHAISPDRALAVSEAVQAAANGARRGADGPVTVEAIPDETRGRLKLVVVGDLRANTALMKAIDSALN